MGLVRLSDEDISSDPAEQCELVSQTQQCSGGTDDTEGTSIQIGTNLEVVRRPLAEHKYWKVRDVVQIGMPAGNSVDMSKDDFLKYPDTAKLLSCHQLTKELSSDALNWKIHFPRSQKFFNVTSDVYGNSHIVPKEIDAQFLDLLLMNQHFEILPDRDSKVGHRRGTVRKPPKFTLTQHDSLEFKIECVTETEEISNLLLRTRPHPCPDDAPWTALRYHLKKGSLMGGRSMYVTLDTIKTSRDRFEMSYRISTNRGDYEWTPYPDDLTDSRLQADTENESMQESSDSDNETHQAKVVPAPLNSSKRLTNSPIRKRSPIRSPIRKRSVGVSVREATSSAEISHSQVRCPPPSASKKRSQSHAEEKFTASKVPKILGEKSNDIRSCWYCCVTEKEDMVAYTCGHVCACRDCYDSKDRAKSMCVVCRQGGVQAFDVKASALREVCEECCGIIPRMRSVLFSECGCCETCLPCFQDIKHFQKCSSHDNDKYIFIKDNIRISK